jgi:DNA (cytosine-5)-methyltransferase 1
MGMPLGVAVRLLPTPDTGTSPAGHGRRGGRPGNGHQSGHDLDAVAQALHPPPPGPGQPDSQAPARAGGVDWGPYETAVRRWEHALGCPAPAPAEQAPGGRLRLAAAFAEWLMGIPGWVTRIPGISRTAQLRLIGNGVVPQQAAAALRLLLQAASAVPSDPGQPGKQQRKAAA